MKKVLAIMLVFCMALTMVPITVSAESAVVSSGNCGQKGDQVTWTLTEDGTLTISGTGRMDDFNSYAMNERGELEYAISWSSYFDRIKALVVEEGVTYIGDHALYQALELTTVDFPESLTEIGDQVFSGCAKLTTINFGTGLTKTGIEVFSNCDGLTAVTLPLGDVQYGRNIFSNCSNLSSVTIPDTQTSISERMFFNCKKLTQIYIPNSVTKIGGKAFEDSGLTSIDIPNSVTSLGKGVFYNCDSLTEVEIPGSVSEIPTELFFSCDNLTGVIFNAGTTELGTGILAYCNKVSEITIPSTVTKLGRTFEHAFGLKTVTFRGDAPEIHSQAFQSVTATAYYPEGNATWTEDKLQDYSGTITWKAYDNTLASGTWGDNISWTLGFDGTLIVSGEGEVAENRNEPYPWKEYAEQIIRVIFEEGVTNVPVSAFEYYYPNLTSAELKSVEIIESTAFAQCTALTSIILPDTLTEIDNGAFSDAGLTTIDIHEGVTRIGMSAFSGSKLTEIVLPDGLLELGNGAFFWCENLKSAYLPDSITKVGMNLFTNCTALETANIPRNLTYVPESMFSGCSSLKSIEIPDGITAMYMNDFEGTALTTVTIPASVTLMGSAFMNCLDLKEIVFEGDAPEMYNSCFRNVVATAYYPAGNETWTEEVMKDYGGTITWVPYEVEVTNFVKWYSGTTSLNGTIDLNIYVLLSDDLVNADDTYVRFTYAGQTVDVPMSKALYSPLDTAPNRYRFSCPIYAKQLTDAVNVKFMKGDAVIGSELNYSVVTYCKNRINNSTDPAEVALCKALMNYGTASQQLFNYNTENLANASLSDADKVLKDVDASAYKYSVTGSESGIKAKSATLMLEDVVKVRVYFTLTGNKSIDDYTFTIDGEVVTPQYNDKGWYVETDGIAAKDLEKMFEVKVGGITVTYGALSYVNSKVNGSNTLESNISKALYAYWQAAEALLG